MIPFYLGSIQGMQNQGVVHCDTSESPLANYAISIRGILLPGCGCAGSTLGKIQVDPNPTADRIVTVYSKLPQVK